MINIGNLLELFSHIHHLRGAEGEDALTNKVALELQSLSLEGRLKCVWFHVPNETIVSNKTDIARLRKKTSLGLIPGAPDFAFLSQKKSLCIELKTAEGKLSAHQKSFREWAQKFGVPYYIARDVCTVKKILYEEELLNE